MWRLIDFHVGFLGRCENMILNELKNRCCNEILGSSNKNFKYMIFMKIIYYIYFKTIVGVDVQS